ncbi:Transmembrane protein [Phytophthora infestans]|uniref:Transmembrane domain-containing protein n=1 Tax=Phytophthora infestans TaxID=4787 RepID=A0A833SFU6_PHYIN|nr:Transmembrane protein [Phytophthora infestans]KAF4139948.1 Transmembrane domain-containing protein [Phytophthora infestans]
MATAVLRARFLLTSGHLVATYLVKTETASIVAYLSFALAGGNLFTGLDVFSSMKNAVHIFCHFVGGVLVCQVILHDLDPGRYLWYVVLLTHVPTSLCTLDTIAQLLLFKTARHPY